LESTPTAHNATLASGKREGDVTLKYKYHCRVSKGTNGAHKGKDAKKEGKGREGKGKGMGGGPR